MKPEDQPCAKEIFFFIEAKGLSIFQGITDSSLLHCLFTHANLHNHNILTKNDGSVMVVLNWEINCIQPAILGVDHPCWLTNQRPENPQFAADNTWWEDSLTTERQRIHAQFEEVSHAVTA